MGQGAAGKMAEVVAPFIGPRRERMEWRRSPAVSAPSRRWFSKVKRGKRSGRDAELVRGKRRRLGGASIKLHPSVGGDDGALRGGVSVGRVAAAQASEGRR